jgi:hypothetical protein
MTSAAHARIPHKHSTAAASPPRPVPRDATSPSHAPDVTPDDNHRASAGPVTTTAAGCPLSPAALAADKVDSQGKTTASSVKSKSSVHSRLASIGRLRSRGSVPQYQQRPQGETVSAQVPVSPSDAGSHHKLSNASAVSNSSSETTLSDDPKSEKKSVEQRPSRPSFWLASGNVPGDFNKAHDDNAEALEQYNRLVQYRPRMMHQTSSKLLRMTDDERPFTRVRSLRHIIMFLFDSTHHGIFQVLCNVGLVSESTMAARRARHIPLQPLI